MELIGQGNGPTTLPQERTLAPSGEDSGRATKSHRHFGDENLFPCWDLKPGFSNL